MLSGRVFRFVYHVTYHFAKNPVFPSKNLVIPRSNFSFFVTSIRLGRGMRFQFVSKISKVINGLSVKQKIMSGYAIVLLLSLPGTIAGLLIGDYFQQEANTQKNKIQRERQLFSHLRNSTLNLQPVKELSASQENLEEFQKTKSRLTQRIKTLRESLVKANSKITNISTEDLRLLIVDYKVTLEKFAVALEETSSSKYITKDSITIDLTKKNLLLTKELNTLLKKYKQQEQKLESNIKQIEILQLFVIVSLLLSMLLTYWIAICTSQSLIKPIKKLNNLAKTSIKKYNFESPTLSLEKQDDINLLSDVLKQLIWKIEALVEEQEDFKATLDSANQTKTKFLANISHELRTPLNGILGYTQLLSRSSNLTAKEKHSIYTIHQCAFHLLTIINDILDFSTIEANQMKLHPVDFYLPSLLQGIVEICQIKAQHKGIKFIYEPSRFLPEGITIDKIRLRQVLINLLSNAIKFTDKGYVKLRVEAVDIEEVDKIFGQYLAKSKICFKVEDTGVGMSPEQIKNIFLPFEKLGNRNNKSEGTGLGLAISQKIVEMMGSSIQAESKIGLGSRFNFEIKCPIAENWTENSTITKKGKIIGYSGETKKIMIVDDSWENRSFIVSLLEPLGFNVIEANNGKQALEIASDNKPDLIISDLEMPEMGGLEMLNKLRQSEVLQNTIVVISSANDFDIENQNVLTEKANDFLAKPIRSKTLYSILEKQLQINWVYTNTQIHSSESSEILSSDEMIIPPNSDLVMLLEYARKGKIKGIKQELEAIVDKDEKYKNFVNLLSDYVKTFNIQKVRQFLQDSLGDLYDSK